MSGLLDDARAIAAAHITRAFDLFAGRNPTRAFIGTLDLSGPFQNVALPFTVRMVC
jgi:hypothetical protein